MTVKLSTGSWADVTAQAEREYGPVGRAVALLAQCEDMESKRLLALQLEAAARAMGSALTVGDLLEWAEQPYSSDGLRETARRYRRHLETQESAGKED